MKRTLTILAYAAVAAFCLQVFSDNKADVDLWGNVAFVDSWPGTPGFEVTNTYSYTDAGHEWVNHEWLGQFILNKTYTHCGAAGLLALKLLLGLCVVAVIHVRARQTRPDGGVFVLWLLLVVSTMGYGFSTRPHHFTYLMTAIFLLLLKQYQRGRLYPLVVFPLLAVVWTNLHGAFFIGIILIVTFVLAELLKAGFRREGALAPIRIAALVLAAAACVAVSLVNPYGVRIWSFIFTSAAKTRTYLSEWAPFNPVAHFYDHVDFMVLVVLTAVALVLTKRRRDFSDVAVLILAAVSAFGMRRNIPLFAITAGIIATPYVDSVARDAIVRLRERFHPAVLAGVLAGFTVLCAGYGFRINKHAPLEIEIPPERFPVETVAFMKEHHIEGNAIVFFDWAEYCIWHLYPGCRVFVDGRFLSAYDEQTLDDYLNFLYLGENWDTALKDYPTDIVLLHPDNPASELMAYQDDWTLAYRTDIAVLFLKTSRYAEVLSSLSGRPATPAAGARNAVFP